MWLKRRTKSKVRGFISILSHLCGQANKTGRFMSGNERSDKQFWSILREVFVGETALFVESAFCRVGRKLLSLPAKHMQVQQGEASSHKWHTTAASRGLGWKKMTSWHTQPDGSDLLDELKLFACMHGSQKWHCIHITHDMIQNASLCAGPHVSPFFFWEETKQTGLNLI